MAYQLRRFPGLVGDLKRTCQGVKMANFDLMKRFDDHIKSEGGYDKVLLTPLSPLSRLSIAIAMMEWAQNQTLKADKPACIKLAQERLLTEFTSLKSNSAVKPIELRDMLLVAIRSVLTAPAGKSNRRRSLVFTMAIGKQIMDLLKGDLLDEATQREIFFEVLKMNPTDEKNIDYLENEASRWSLEHLAVAMMFKPSPLLFHRLTELSPTERPAAVAKIIQAMQTTPHVVSLSIYAKNILHVCGMCLATLTHELTSDTESLISSIIELFRDIANETSLPRNQKTFAESPPFRISSIPQDHELREIQSGYEMGDPLNSPKANMVVKDTYPRIYNLPFVYKGYVYRRMTDWIKVLPDRGFAHEMASALSTSFNFFTPDTPD
jgi:hypothetical protein